MAPLDTARLTDGLGALYIRESGATEGPQAAANPVEGAATAPAASSTLYLGIGAGVGGAILLAIIAVGIGIVRKRAQHRRAVAELEQSSETVTPAQDLEIREVPRPASIARCGGLGPLHAKAGWGALSSEESVHQPEPAVGRRDKRKRDSISLPKRIKHRGIPLKRLKHLSAIIESPRSRAAASPTPGAAIPEVVVTPVKPASASKSSSKKKETVMLVRSSDDEDDDVFTAPGSPKPHVLPSFAIRSPGMYGAAIANDEKPRAPRSISVGALLRPIPEDAIFGHTKRISRPGMHSRSASLGAPTSRPPSGPVPPLPVIAPHDAGASEQNRQGMCVSRSSSSSQESASSSVLVTSPIIKTKIEDGRPLGSPTVETVIADDDSAQLKSVTNRQWQNPLITGPRPMEEPRLDDTAVAAGAEFPRHNTSIRSTAARYSTLDHRRVSAGSSISTLDDEDIARPTTTNRLSIPEIATADSMSISRVSSLNSLNSLKISPVPASHTSASGAVRKLTATTTPRKPNRQTTVSAAGSPAERRKTSILRERSGNAQLIITPSRQASQSTQNSARSSNGNPFQWDQSLPLTKPSALKGSPNSKGSKGHRRQNCVRISTLTPQILGPSSMRGRRRSMSPVDVMHGILEEGEGEAPAMGREREASCGSLMGGLVVNKRLNALRASLTPSSPTLSAWTAYQEHHQQQQQAPGLPSQHSESQLSVSPMHTNRTASRISNRSSAFSIPSFPPPNRASVSVGAVQVDHHPIPEFSLSRPSTDEAQPSSSPSLFALHASSGLGDDDGTALPSSPPLPVSKTVEYDPAWPMLAIPLPNTGKGAEYDPASPLWPPAESMGVEEPSSPAFFPFTTAAAGSDDLHTVPAALHNSDDSPISPLSRPSSMSYGGEMPDSPPCSPKSTPDGFKDVFATQTQGQRFTSPPIQPRQARPTAAEKLTSANASAIMATIPESPPTVGFPSAVPILPPPEEDEEPDTTPAGRQRASSLLHPLRSAPPPPMQDATPSPLHTAQSLKQTSPLGPREEPAKSVLKNAMALRRMNSEIDQARNTNRASRHYVRLGREASPLLSCIGSPDPSESYNDLFDFDFGSLDADTGAGAGAEVGSALDEIDFNALTRTLDGALAGFEVPASVGEDGKRERESSVWEDGEKFWLSPRPQPHQHQQPSGPRPLEGKPGFSFTPSSPPSVVNVTPLKKGYRRDQENVDPLDSDRSSGSLTPRQQVIGGGCGVLLEPPSSISKTPRSLYDSEGFLRS